MERIYLVNGKKVTKEEYESDVNIPTETCDDIPKDLVFIHEGEYNINE